MGLKEIPHGEPLFVDNLGELYPDSQSLLKAIHYRRLFGTLHCKVRSTAKGMSKKPLHSRHRDGMLLFEHLVEWKEMYLFTEEVRYGLEHGLYEYQAINALTFAKNGTPVRGFFEEGFKEKAAQKKAGNSGRESAAKVCINSLYGAFGLVTSGKDAIEFYNVDNCDVYKYLHTGKLKDIKLIGDTVMLRVEKNLPVRDFNVQISSAITSYARIHMYKIMNYIESKGGMIVYTDTDSIQTDFNIFADTEFMQTFCSNAEGKIDWTGAVMGGIKCEITDDVEKQLKKRFSKMGLVKTEVDAKVSDSLKLIRQHDGNLSPGGIGVDVSTNKGNKDYDLYRDFSEILGFELQVWKTAHKGFKKETKECPSYMVSPELSSMLYDAFYALDQQDFKQVCGRIPSMLTMTASQVQRALLNGAVRVQIQKRASFAKKDQIGEKGFGISWKNSIRTMSMMPQRGKKRDNEGTIKNQTCNSLRELLEYEIGRWNTTGFGDYTNKVRQEDEDMVPKYRKGMVHAVEGVESCYRVVPFKS